MTSLAPRVKWSRGSDGAKAVTGRGAGSGMEEGEVMGGGGGGTREGGKYGGSREGGGQWGNRKRLRFAMRSTDENHHLELWPRPHMCPGGWMGSNCFHAKIHGILVRNNHDYSTYLEEHC